MKKFKQMAEVILSAIGGKENVIAHTNCATRLRITPVDKEKVDIEKLKSFEFVFQVIDVGGVIQVVLGPGTVDEVESEFAKLLMTNHDKLGLKDKKTKNYRQQALIFIQATMMPTVGVLIGAALLIALTNVLLLFGLKFDQENNTFIYLLNNLGNLMTGFIGVFLAISATKALKSKSYVPLLFALFIYLGDINGVKLGPVTLQQGIGGVIGILLLTIILVFVERQVKKIIPKMISLVFVPLVTLIIGMTLFVFIIAPIGNILTIMIMALINFFLEGSDIIYVIGHSFLALIWPLLVLTGTHQVVFSVTMPYFEVNGIMPLVSGAMLFTASVGGAAIGTAIKYRKDKILKEAAVSGSITSFLGVTEPTIYGVLITKERNFFLTMISSGIGGLVVGLLKIQIGFGVPGIFVVTTVTDPQTMFLPYLAIYLLTAVMAAGLILLFGSTQKVTGDKLGVN